MTFLITFLYLLGLVGILYLLYIASCLKKFIEVAIAINKINGPPALPILGNLHQIRGTPAQIFHNMRQMVRLYGPVFRAWVGVYPSINFTCPDHTEALIGSSKHNTKGIIYEFFHCWLNTGLLTSQGAKWFHRRKILTPSFHFNILVQFVDIFNKHSVTLVEQLRKQGSDGVEVTSIVSEYTLQTICESSMGISLPYDLDEKTTYINSVKKFGTAIVERVTNPLIYPDITFAMSKLGATNRKVCKYLHDFSTKVIETRSREYEKSRGREKAVDDDGDAEVPRKKRVAMLDLLLGVKYDDGAIDDEGIREEVDTFIFEGHDTTAVSLSYSLMLLACNKHCQDKICEEIQMVLGDSGRMPTYKDLIEMEYLKRCIKESLRLYPSVPIISRKAQDGLTVDGRPVPVGCMANVWIFEMHRNKKYFPDPEKFDPDRFLPENTVDRHPFVYIPFSAGPRNCIGQRFAMLEMEACLIAILRNFSLEPIDTPETIELIPDLILRTLNDIKVKFVPRS